MKIIKTQNYDEMTQKSLEIVVNLLLQKPDCVISMTTGASPEGLAKELAKKENEGLDLSQSTFINLDEFIAPVDSVFSVRRFMDEFLYGRLHHMPKKTYMFDGEAQDWDQEIQRYKKILKENPRDLQILGLGINGHVGCNEPGTPFDQEAFVGYLSQSTIEKTIDQFHLPPEKCPKAMFTMGLKEIMEAKRVLLQVSGTNKAKAVKMMLEGEITPQCPASILRTHPDFILILDEDAAKLLKQSV